LKFVA